MSLNFFNTILSLSTFCFAFLGILVILRAKKEQTNILWSLSCISASLWSLSFLILINLSSYKTAEIFQTILDLFGILSIFFWSKFILKYTDKEKIQNIFGLYIGSICLILLNFSPWFVGNLTRKSNFNFYANPNIGYTIFFAFFIFWSLYGIFLLLHKILSEKEYVRRGSIYILIASVVGLMGGGSSFLLTYDIYESRFLIVLFFLLPPIIIFTIVKHGSFGIKIFKPEIAIFLMWLITYTELVLSKKVDEFILRSLTFISILIIGLYLIKLIIKYINQQDYRELLISNFKDTLSNLSDVNTSLENKIEGYKYSEEITKDEMQRLSDNKNQLIRIMHHNLRYPVSEISKNVKQLILESKQNNDTKHLSFLYDIKKNSESIDKLCRDILKISNESNMLGVLELEETSVTNIIKETLFDMNHLIENKKIMTTFTYDDEDYIIDIDKLAIKNSLIIIIENAIKYNLPDNGYININISKHVNDMIISIESSGIGIEKDDLRIINNHRIFRSEEAKRLNPGGTGIGLTICKTLIKAHKGKLTVVSKGKNMGVIVTIRIPLNRK